MQAIAISFIPCLKVMTFQLLYSCDQICMMILSLGSKTIPPGTLTNNILASFRHLAYLVTWYVNKYRCLKQKTRSIDDRCPINHLNSQNIEPTSSTPDRIDTLY